MEVLDRINRLQAWIAIGCLLGAFWLLVAYGIAQVFS
jgi:hypothetical protein